MKTILRPILFLFFIVAGFCRAQITNSYDVRSFGAVGDGATLDTTALQAAIDKCSAAEGGTVLVAGGRYVTGTLPARGLFAHHVKGIKLHNVEFNTKTPDVRPAMVFQDVTESKTDASPVPATLP